MTLEILHPITIRLDGQTIQYNVGDQIDLSKLKGQRLLEQAGPKVRPLRESESPTIATGQSVPQHGQWIEFDSPLFGLCTGQVVLADGDMVIIQYHSILHDERCIKLDWVTQILNERP